MTHKSARLVPLLLLFSSLIRPADLAEARTPAQAADCTTASPSADPGIGPTPTVCVSDVIITTDGLSPDNRFSVSWVSAAPETGQVQVVGGDTFGDARGSSFTGITHYVVVSNLQPSTPYQFDVISGAGTFTNGGQHWSIKTGPVLPPPTPDPIIGRVKDSDGGDAGEALVYARIQRSGDSATSSLLSMNPPMTADDGGFFHGISLSDARSVDSNLNYGGRFNYNPNNDRVTITAVGPVGRSGPGGFASTNVNINAAHPRPGGVNVILTLGSGFVPYETPTATAIPPTSTRAPVLPTATLTLSPLTATALAATQTATAFTTTPNSTPVPPAATAPPPTAIRRPTSVPTATGPLITIVPADETQVAQATSETTQAAATEPPITRPIHPFTVTPPASSAFAGIDSTGSIFALLAVAAFAGAGVLGAAALFIWKIR